MAKQSNEDFFVGDVQGTKTEPSAPYDTLNPAVQPVGIQEFTNAAKSINADSSKGDLFSAIGKIGTEVVEGVDKFFKERIRGEATAEVDKEREKWTAMLTSGVQGDKPPPEIAQAANNLRNMQLARDNGVLRPEYYHMNLDQIARQLRSRYPGYREHIDNVIQDLTGITPANKVISDLFSANKKSGDPEQALNNHYRKEATDIGLGGWMAQYVQDNGGYPPNLVFEQKISEIKGAAYRNNNAKTALALAEAQNSATEKEAERVHMDSFQFKFANEQKNGGGLFTDINKFRKNVDEAVGNLAVDGATLSASQTQQLQQGIISIRNKAYALLNQEWAEAGPSLTEQAKDRMKKTLDMQLDNMFAGMGGGGKVHIGLLDYVGTQLDMMSKGDHLNALNSSESLRKVSAARKIIGDQSLSVAFMQTGPGRELMTNSTRDAVALSLSKRVTREETLSSGIVTNKDKQGAASALINGSIAAMMDDTAKPEGLRNVMDMIYHSGNNFLTLKDEQGRPLIDPKDHHRVFSEMTSPRIVARIQNGIKEGIVSQDQWSKYRNWVDYTGTVLGRKDMTDSKVQALNPESSWTIVYDPTTNRFNPTAKTPGTYGKARDRIGDESSAHIFADRFNKVTAPIIGVLKAEGAKPDEINNRLTAMFKSQGIELNIQTVKQPKSYGKSE